jgi:hypothetical protein
LFLISHGVGDRKTKLKSRPVKCTKGFFWVKEYAKVCLPVNERVPWGAEKAQKSPYFEAIKSYKLTYLDNEFLEGCQKNAGF